MPLSYSRRPRFRAVLREIWGLGRLVAAPRYRLEEASERWPSTTLTLQLVEIYNFAEETKAVDLTAGEFVMLRARSWSPLQMTAFFHTTIT